jgi:hypothetical protein
LDWNKWIFFHFGVVIFQNDMGALNSKQSWFDKLLPEEILKPVMPLSFQMPFEN